MTAETGAEPKAPAGRPRAGGVKFKGLCVGLFFLALLVAACGGVPEPVQAFYSGDLDRAVDGFEEQAAAQDKSYVMHSLDLGSAAITAGYYDLADKAFSSAINVMWSSTGGGRGAMSLIGPESVKIFKGEPFEKAMASFYVGLINYQRGDYDNAGAAFRKALLADKQADEKHREDFALVQYMLARCYVKEGALDNAELLLKRARLAYPNNPYLSLEKIKDSNLVLITETGHAPQKYRHGPGASLDEFKEIRTKDVGSAATVGGAYIGQASEAIDLFYQAKTRGSSGKDGVQAAKGVARTGAAVAAVASDNTWVKLGAGLFAALYQSEADIRQWHVLPQKVGILSAKVRPGRYDFQIDFLNGSGAKLSDYTQLWQNVPVHKGRDTLYLFRALPGQGGVITRQRPAKPKLENTS